MNIYLISGLGADSSVWRNLQFHKEDVVYYLDWIQPILSESLRSYALRLATAINTEQPFNLIGLSFGGMLAVEIAAELHPLKTILISSVSSRQELPWYYLAAGKIGLTKLIPSKTPKKSIALVSPFFGAESAIDRDVFQELIERSDPVFSKWAIEAILQWDRMEAPDGLIRIHGTRDNVLPLRKRKADYLIKDGGHFMVFNRAMEISGILEEIDISITPTTNEAAKSFI